MRLQTARWLPGGRKWAGKTHKLRQLHRFRVTLFHVAASRSLSAGVKLVLNTTLSTYRMSMRSTRLNRWMTTGLLTLVFTLTACGGGDEDDSSVGTVPDTHLGNHGVVATQRR